MTTRDSFLTLTRSGYQWRIAVYTPSDEGMGHSEPVSFHKSAASAKAAMRRLIRSSVTRRAYADYTGDRLVWRSVSPAREG